MAKDVEVNVTASDRTGMALAKAEAAFRRTQAKILADAKNTNDKVSDGLGDSVAKSAPKLGAQVAKVFGTAGVSGGQFLAAGLAAASPLIGSVVSAGIIGGAGIGGVIGGVLLAARDPRVKAAGKTLQEGLLGSLTQDAAPFVEPVIDAIHTIEGAFASSEHRIKSIFADSSEFVEPLVRGLTRGADGVLRGIETLVAKGRPVIDAFGNSFDIIGNSVGDALDTIAGGSEEAASGLTALATVLGETIEVTGYVIRGLTELSGIVGYIPTQIANAERSMGLLEDTTTITGEAARHTATETGYLSGAIDAETEAARNAVVTIDDMVEAKHKLAGVNADLYGSETATEQAFRTANETIKENGRTISKHTEKGLENRSAISQVASALQRQYDAFVQVNGVGPKASAVASRLRDRFQALAEKAGYGAREARALANSILDLPSNKTVNITVRTTRRGEKLYGNQASQFAAADSSFYAAAAGAGVSRTGGPAEVAVTSEISVNLDGTPFRSMSARAAQRETDRAAWRQKVGQR